MGETLLKSEGQHLYHIYWSMWKKFRLKRSPWVICKMLRLFINALTPDNKYSLLNSDTIKQYFTEQLSQKRNLLSKIFLHFLNLDSILKIFQKKITLIADVFLNLQLQKAWLDKCLKSPLSEDSSTRYIINGPKHCWNLNDSTFAIFIHACKINSDWKSVSQWYAESYDCLLTHWLLITSILSLIETFYSNIFRCNYIKKEIYFPICFCLF